MAENTYTPQKVELIQKPIISEDDARLIAKKWIKTNILVKHDVFRLGKAVMVYYPFWKYVREDGNEIKTIYKPACGLLLHNVQELTGDVEFVPENGEPVFTPSINASYYYPEIYGIPRDEKLVGIPFWLISYKYKNSIYMLKLGAGNGIVIPEWHPFKDPINWPRIAMFASIPVFIMSFLVVFVHPIFYLFIALFILILLGYSRMLSILNTKRAEGINGN